MYLIPGIRSLGCPRHLLESNYGCVFKLKDCKELVLWLLMSVANPSSARMHYGFGGCPMIVSIPPDTQSCGKEQFDVERLLQLSSKWRGDEEVTQYLHKREEKLGGGVCSREGV